MSVIDPTPCIAAKETTQRMISKQINQGAHLPKLPESPKVHAGPERDPNPTGSGPTRSRLDERPEGSVPVARRRPRTPDNKLTRGAILHGTWPAPHFLVQP